MRDFFAFRTMITAGVVQVVFVLGLVVVVIAGIGAIANDEPLLGILVLAIGALYWRILCELMIVIFRMNSSLSAIRANTAGLAVTNPVEATGAAPSQHAPGPHEPTSSGASTATTGTLPPAGWYPDPERPGRKRWWDGTRWGRRDDEEQSEPQ